MNFERLAPEQHDTLDDIPEPSEATALAGHDEIMVQLVSAYRTGKLHHALLLAGHRGIGKATLAFHFARFLLQFPDPGAAPQWPQPTDPQAQLFRQVAQGAHPAVLHLTRPINDRTKGFKSVLTVDEVRRISRFLSMTAPDRGYRIVIVDTADDMNVNAANALLKNLEEPPKRTLFLLISHRPGRLLPTIRSRCQLIRMLPLQDAELIGVFERLEIPLPAGTAERDDLVRRAEGSVRHALLLSQYGGLEIAAALGRLLSAPSFDLREAMRIADAVSARDAETVLRMFNQSALDAAWSMASAMVERDELEAAARLAELHDEIARTIAQTETYNLDRRQHAMGLMHRLRDAASG